MNVGYKDLNCEDVGKALRLDKATISAWCRKGYVSYVDVSEPGSTKPRYMIPQPEFERIQKLIRKYGKRNWLLYNKKDEETVLEAKEPVEAKEVIVAQTPTATVKKVQLNVSVPEQDRQRVLDECKKRNLTQGDFMHMLLNEQLAKVEETPVMTEEVKESKPVDKKFTIDQMINRLEQMREIEERINNLEAELNQLRNEEACMRQELIDNI